MKKHDPAERDAVLTALQQKLAERQRSARFMAERWAECERQVQRLAGRLSACERELDAIHRSRHWRLMRKYWDMRAFVDRTLTSILRRRK